MYNASQKELIILTLLIKNSHDWEILTKSAVSQIKYVFPKSQELFFKHQGKLDN